MKLSKSSSARPGTPSGINCRIMGICGGQKAMAETLEAHTIRLLSSISRLLSCVQGCSTPLDCTCLEYITFQSNSSQRSLASTLALVFDFFCQEKSKKPPGNPSTEVIGIPTLRYLVLAFELGTRFFLST